MAFRKQAHWQPIAPKSDLTNNLNELIAKLIPDPDDQLKNVARITRRDITALLRVLQKAAGSNHEGALPPI